MKNKILGATMVIIGALIGLYVGGWLMFIGGIVQVIQEVRAEHLSAVNIGIGVARIMLAGFIGTVCGLALIVPGQIIWEGGRISFKNF